MDTSAERVEHYGPVAAHERLFVLDVLRGFALLAASWADGGSCPARG
jgi:uncharacterized membrane protein YeiB